MRLQEIKYICDEKGEIKNNNYLVNILYDLSLQWLSLTIMVD